MAKLVHNVQKKQHRERAQTSNRARFGHLEKKKDYRLRAADYHKKQAALKALKAKAAQYNPDEYYHAMINKKTDDQGIIITERDSSVELTPQQMKLFKSQDVNYVRTMRLNEVQKIRKLKDQLGFKAGGKHTVFVDDEKQLQSFDPEEFFQTDESMLSRRENRLRREQLEKNEKVISEVDPDDREELEKSKLVAFRLLKERMEREKQLREVEEKLEATREVMKNGSKKKMVDDEGNVHFKWKNERKK